MLKPKYSKKFKRDLKKYENQLKVMQEIECVLHHLLNSNPLPEKYCDHLLSGDWTRHRECHVKPDVLLIYRKDQEYLYLERIGSHSELFR